MKSFSRIEARIASVSPPQRSVRPIERRNSVSPAKRIGWSPSSRKQVEPGVCPGVWMARSAYGPKRIVSASASGVSGGSGASARRPKKAGLLGQRVVEGAVGRMEADRRSRGFLDRPRAGDVVEVRVRVDEGDGHELCRFESAQDALGLVARIDDDRLARNRIREHRAVALQRPDRKRLDDRLRAHGFTATTVSTSWRSLRAGLAQIGSVEEGESWIAHSWLSGRRRSEAKSLRRLRGVKISQRT